MYISTCQQQLSLLPLCLMNERTREGIFKQKTPASEDEEGSEEESLKKGRPI